MSIDVESTIECTCDKCGKWMSEDEATVLCKKCATNVGVGSVEGYCSPVLLLGKYTCKNTHHDFDWGGELPLYCPMCGREIRR